MAQAIVYCLYTLSLNFSWHTVVTLRLAVNTAALLKNQSERRPFPVIQLEGLKNHRHNLGAPVDKFVKNAQMLNTVWEIIREFRILARSISINIQKLKNTISKAQKMFACPVIKFLQRLSLSLLQYLQGSVIQTPDTRPATWCVSIELFPWSICGVYCTDLGPLGCGAGPGVVRMSPPRRCTPLHPPPQSPGSPGSVRAGLS